MGENGRHKACKNCRERKIKCDGGQPSCGRCSRCGVECLYAPPSKRYNKVEFATVLETLNNRLSQAEAAAVAATANSSMQSSFIPTHIPAYSSSWEPYSTMSSTQTALAGLGYLNGHDLFSAAGQCSGADLGIDVDVEPVCITNYPAAGLIFGQGTDSSALLPSAINRNEYGQSLGVEVPRPFLQTHPKRNSEIVSKNRPLSSILSHASSDGQVPELSIEQEASRRYEHQDEKDERDVLCAAKDALFDPAKVGSQMIGSKRRRLNMEMETGEMHQSDRITTFGSLSNFDVNQESSCSSISSLPPSGCPQNTDSPLNSSRSNRPTVEDLSERLPLGKSGIPSPNLLKPPSPCSSAMRRVIGTGTAFNSLVKLRGPENYSDWARAIRAAARKEGVWDIMTGSCVSPTPLSPNATLAEQQEYQDDIVYWTNKTELALGSLEGSLVNEIQASVENIECPRTMWLRLERDYKPVENKDLFNLIYRLDTISLKACGNVERLAKEFREIQERVNHLKKNKTLPDWYFALRFLHSLGSGYEDFITEVLTESQKKQDIEISFDQTVHEALLEEAHLR